MGRTSSVFDGFQSLTVVIINLQVSSCCVSSRMSLTGAKRDDNFLSYDKSRDRDIVETLDQLRVEFPTQSWIVSDEGASFGLTCRCRYLVLDSAVKQGY